MRTVDSLPEVPGRRRFSGHSEALQHHRLRLFEQAQAAGPLTRMDLFGRRFLVANTPELAQELLVEHAKHTRKSPGLKLLLSHLAGEGLFMSEGELWRRQRRLMAPLFQPANLSRYAQVMTDTALEVVDGWKDRQALDLAHEMTRITMFIVGRTLFGAQAFTEDDEVAQAITVLLGWVNDNIAARQLVTNVVLQESVERLLPKLPLPAALKAAVDKKAHTPFLIPGADSPAMVNAKATIERRLGQLIAERRAHPTGRDDLLTRLLAAQDEDGTVMTDQQLRDESATLFVAGHETTANALAWSLKLLARNPSWQDKLQAEVDGLGGRPPTFQDVARMPVVQRVFKEAMRLFPPVTLLVRQALEPITLGDVAVPKRSIVFVPIWSLHRHPSVWPDPDRFDPDRFTPEAEAQRHRAAWLPFGTGPRVCIGNHFALLEGPLVLATIFQKVRVEVTDPSLDTDEFATLRPRGGVQAVVRRAA